jgi:hypothetical protein
MQKIPAGIEIERTLRTLSAQSRVDRNAMQRVVGLPSADLLSTAQTGRLADGGLPQLPCICRRTANAHAKPAGLDDAEQIKLQIKSNWARRPRVTYSRGPET